MKKLFQVVIAVIVMVMSAMPLASAQEQENIKPKPLSYSEVVQVEGLSAEEIYAKARSWVATTFNSANDVTQLAENNKIVLKAVEEYDFKLNGMTGSHNRVNYTFTVECRDGRYKMSVTNMILTSRITTIQYNPKIEPMDFGILTDAPTNDAPAGMGAAATKKQCEKIWTAAKVRMETVILGMAASLSESMAVDQSEDDW